MHKSVQAAFLDVLKDFSGILQILIFFRPIFRQQDLVKYGVIQFGVAFHAVNALWHCVLFPKDRIDLVVAQW